MEVTLYTTHCPKCMVLYLKLTQKGIKFKEITSMEAIEKLGFLSAPILKVNDEYLQFKQAIDWVNAQ